MGHNTLNEQQSAIVTRNRENNKRYMIYINLLLIVGCILIGLYFLNFNNGLSTSQNDWGNFGGYISGIASLLNVIIFTWLTISIQQSGDKEREKDREHKKLLLITQIRKEELINLEKILNDTIQITDLHLPAFYKFSNAKSYLINYSQSHKSLFPLLDNNDVKQMFIEASDQLEIMRIEAMKSLGFNEKGEKVTDQISPLSDKFINASKEFQRLKILLISKLENDIINQINA